jgi:type IV pilus assembly protein PilB
VLDKGALEVAGFRVGTDIEAYEPVGCGRCNTTGYRGRSGIYSVMTMSEALKDLTVANAPQAEITRLARTEGMLTLREDGLAKVTQGITSIEEVARVAV